MKRLASLINAALLLSVGAKSNATTTYAMYLQPISPTTMQAGPNAVFTFRALIDIPAQDASNNATLALTLGVPASARFRHTDVGHNRSA